MALIPVNGGGFVLVDFETCHALEQAPGLMSAARVRAAARPRVAGVLSEIRRGAFAFAVSDARQPEEPVHAQPMSQVRQALDDREEPARLSSWLMSARAAAEVLRVDPATVRRSVRRGELNGDEIGGVYIVTRESVEALRRSGGVAS